MKSVTIKDIAKIAGVSTSTVSRALSGSSELSERTRARILDICRKEGYRVNALARGLICSRTNVIGLIVPKVSNPFYAELSFLIETYARSLGYNLILSNSMNEPDTTAELFDFLLSHRVDGVILASSHNEAANWIREHAASVPTVLLGTSVLGNSGAEINSVSIDNYIGGKLAAEYLLSLGHTKILYFGARTGSMAHQLRHQGFADALAEAGLTADLIESPYASSSISNGYQLGKELFTKPLPYTAIFAATDSVALGIIQVADEAGISIPEDISLIGFDNIIYSSLPKITLSTIDQRKQLLAESAVNLLAELINQPGREDYTHRMIRPALVARDSCKKLI